jgi:hypothetical protein
MLDDLRMEIIVLQETNLELWAQITDRSVGKGEHQKIRNLPLQKMD